jgi:Protein of unknown function (DUF2796)
VLRGRPAVRSAVILAAMLLGAPAMAHTTASAQAPAHQHGAGTLHVSIDGSALQIAFEGPADNLLGFEHAPQNETQKQAVARAQRQLNQPNQLLAIPAAAECQAQPSRVDIKLPAPGSGETHSEIEAEWRWQCAKPSALTHVDAGGLFKAFPRLKELNVQVVTAEGQKTALLKPGAPRLKIAS